jgi:hypothetical protein
LAFLPDGKGKLRFGHHNGGHVLRFVDNHA